MKSDAQVVPPRRSKRPMSRPGICRLPSGSESWCPTLTSASGRTRTARSADVYPALAAVLRRICSASAWSASTAKFTRAATADFSFSIMSVSKPFVFALVFAGPGRGRMRAGGSGVNATGLPFNSLAAVERSEDGRTNPMVNSGAIATTSLVPGSTLEAQVAVHPGRLIALCGPSAGQ